MSDRTARVDAALDAMSDEQPPRRTIGGVVPARARPWTRSIRNAFEVVRSRHIRIWLAVVLTTVIVGTIGYVVLFRWSFVDSVYMTVITMTTVGYREVRELVDWPERLWTMLLAIAGVGIIYGSIGIVAEAILAEASSGRREERRMAEALADMNDHFILCGYGRVGSTVARELGVAEIDPKLLVDASSEHFYDVGHLTPAGCAIVGNSIAQAVLRERRSGLASRLRAVGRDRHADVA